ncbi:hypothetical protein QP179_03915 [Sphingomonas aurantiaca]|uniref:hypothetical protein n=1 Tax=Sphingomonas aurantiaca TaxID=185949 RepID=UPI002FE33668
MAISVSARSRLTSLFSTISSISASIVWYDASVSSGDGDGDSGGDEVWACPADGSMASNAQSDTAYE